MPITYSRGPRNFHHGGKFTTKQSGGSKQVFLNGLNCYYLMDEGSGQVLNDLSGNGFDGQLGSTSGVDMTDPAWVAKGLRFDGIDDFCDLTGLTGPSGDHTFMFGVSPNNATVPGSLGETLFDTLIGRFLCLQNIATGSDDVGWFDGSYKGQAPATVGDQILTFRFTGAIGETFRNKSSLGTDAYVAQAVGGTVKLGTFIGGGHPYEGDMSCFLHYTRAFSTPEIHANVDVLTRILAGRGFAP